MTRRRYCYLIPLFHFLLAWAVAYAVHYANCLNVWSCKGDYSKWMNLGSNGYLLLQASKWIAPVAFAVCMLAKRSQKKDYVLQVAIIALLVLFVTDYFYMHLIFWWERDWGRP
jgi:hypothetical protein